jgi:hypothetical protein
MGIVTWFGSVNVAFYYLLPPISIMLTQWGSYGHGAGELDGPTGADVDRKSNTKFAF